MGKPKISIIVAVYNGASTLQRCIDSVVEQSYANKELIVIDGASTDGTIPLLQQQVKNLDYWESAPDRGIYHAWNKALKHTQGEWVCFLGADDYFWDSSVLERVVPHLIAAYPPTPLVYGKAALVARDGRVVEVRGQAWSRARRPFLQGVPGSSMPHQGVLHHRSIFQKAGTFDELFRIAGDYDLLLRTLKHTSPLFVSDVIMAGMEHGGVSTEAHNALQSLCEIARAREKNSIQGISFLWHWTYAKALVRDFLARIAGDRFAQCITNIYRSLTGRQSI